MAVADTFALNEQPGVGFSNYIPLGRFGDFAPHSMYEVSASLASDATGGNNVITITSDPRFATICTLMNAPYSGAAAGIEILFQMRDTSKNGAFARGFANAVPIATVGGFSLAVWNPPPIMTMDTWSLLVANTDADISVFNAWFYNFDIRILEKSPMWRILANLPRPGTMDSFSVA